MRENGLGDVGVATPKTQKKRKNKMQIDTETARVILEKMREKATEVIPEVKKEAEIELPLIKDDITFIKIDMLDYKTDEVTININSQTSTFLDEVAAPGSSQKFMKFKCQVMRHNKNNFPSQLGRSIDCAEDWENHPFYKKILGMRKKVLKFYKDKDMAIQPYLSNYYINGEKNAGLVDFMCSLVWQEKDCNPNIIFMWGDFDIHVELEWVEQKPSARSAREMHTYKNKIRPYLSSKVNRSHDKYWKTKS